MSKSSRQVCATNVWIPYRVLVVFSLALSFGAAYNPSGVGVCFPHGRSIYNASHPMAWSMPLNNLVSRSPPASATETNLTSLKVSELKAKLRAFGFKVSGNKAQLIARLEQHAAVQNTSWKGTNVLPGVWDKQEPTPRESSEFTTSIWEPTDVKLKSSTTRNTKIKPKSPKVVGFEAIARAKFGIQKLKPVQVEVMSKIMQSQSTLAVLPTGYGKSLCYQLPSFLFESGISVLVSPLLALMREQEAYLRDLGLPARRIDSTLQLHEAQEALEEVKSGAVKLLLVSPERFQQRKFKAALCSAPGGMQMLVIDEAHTISEWGPSFRPEYLLLGKAAKLAKVVLALTATATPKVRNDVMNRLGIKSLVTLPSQRPNLLLTSQGMPEELSIRVEALAQKLALRPKGDAIVYVRTRRDADDVAQALIDALQDSVVYDVRSFHAGQSALHRSDTQQWFSKDSSDAMKVLCCTIAFGMGMDKPDVRYVYHLQLPQSLESYSQGVGRAGRDGNASLCEVFLSPRDVIPLQNYIHSEAMDASSVAKVVDLLVGSPSVVSTTLRSLSTSLKKNSLVYSESTGSDGLLEAVHIQPDGERWVDLRGLSLLLDEREAFISVLISKLEDVQLLERSFPFYAEAKVTLTPEGREAGDRALQQLGSSAIHDGGLTTAFKSLKFGSIKERAATLVALMGARELQGRPRSAKIFTVDIVQVARELTQQSAASVDPTSGLSALSACEVAGYASCVKLKKPRCRLGLAGTIDESILNIAEKELLIGYNSESAMRAGGVSDSKIRDFLAQRLWRESLETKDRDCERVMETFRLLIGCGVNTTHDAIGKPVSISCALEHYFDLPHVEERYIGREAAFFNSVLSDIDKDMDVDCPSTAFAVYVSFSGADILNSDGLSRACCDDVEDDKIRSSWDHILRFASSPRGRWMGLHNDPRRLARFAAGAMSPRTSSLMRRNLPSGLPDYFKGNPSEIARSLRYCKWNDVLRLAQRSVTKGMHTDMH